MTLEPAPFAVISIHLDIRITFPPSISGKVHRIMRDFRPYIIHVQNHFQLGAACWNFARTYRVPVVGTYHFMPDKLFEVIASPLTQLVAAALWQDFLRKYNHQHFVTAPSQAGQKILLELGLTVKKALISNGIDLEAYRKLAVSEEVHRRYGLH